LKRIKEPDFSGNNLCAGMMKAVKGCFFDVLAAKAFCNMPEETAPDSQSEKFFEATRETA
jgi:hypothetical protein